MAEDREANPVRLLEIAQSYLVIAGSRHEEFAEEACTDVALELKRMQTDFGMSQQMVDGVTGVLKEEGRPATARARAAAKLIGEVLAGLEDPT